MIHHIIMIKLKPFSGKEEKNEKANEIKTALESLPGKIKEIQFYEVGLNIIESERASDLVIISKFKDLEDLNNYSINPFHQAVVKIIKEYSNSITSVDFEK
jgi:hypothetical protein